ncbi:helix-turn-helix domain-containing protein [Streptosporangium carneum]|uniref:AraC family transcriptional regulator n=1 Tax=Streptosporangium carneum TaxID=47481 RepID=A0A9W6ICT5_9ACTN|nr:helix-turn-helix domain-containing protein [Streptosporangium carneum]GLK15110.1 AraC family transcriptional regulator [Streptosporangium carneum]
MAENAPDGSTAESVVRKPPPELRPFVVRYTGYRETGMPPGRHRGLPSPYLTLIVTLDDPLVLAVRSDGRPGPVRYDALVGGLHTTPALITHDGSQSGVQLALTPLGARALLGLPAGELAGADLHLADVAGPLAERLRGRVLEGGGWAGRFAALDAVLLERLRAESAVPAEVAWVWERLLATGGVMPVSELAREVGWSGRYLSRRFTAEIGLRPKETARVVRFDRARRLLQRSAASGGGLTLAELAARCGYYDQAHLAREFGALAGCPPSRWLAEEFRNVQAMAAVLAEDSQA